MMEQKLAALLQIMWCKSCTGDQDHVLSRVIDASDNSFDHEMGLQEYIARFGHGSAKLARQAQSKEKTLEKMVRLLLQVPGIICLPASKKMQLLSDSLLAMRSCSNELFSSLCATLHFGRDCQKGL